MTPRRGKTVDMGSDPDHLTALLIDAKRGDHDALERFVVETHRDVVAICRYLGDPDTADDLAQETYARAFSSLHRFQATGPARHWLLTIARRTCADATRRRSRIRRLGRRVAAEPVDLVVGPVEAGVELDEALLALDPDRRAAFVLTQVTGLRYDEAADLLGVPIGTIRSRVARARADLAAALSIAVAEDDRADREPDRLATRPLG
jgi:RNA polymerase sigma-70 factor, ECF subfamily